MSRFLLSFFLLISVIPGFSQGITGSWEGEADGERVQLNVKEINGKFCGYTFDQVLDERNSFCRQHFTGSYDPSLKIYIFSGVSFIHNSGSHTLIELRLRKERIEGEIVLRGYIATKSSFQRMIGSFPQPITLKKVSKNPKPLADGHPICPEQPKSLKPVPPVKKDPVKPAPPKPVPTPKQETKPVPAPPVTPQKVVPKRDTAVITKPTIPATSYKARSNKEIRRIEVDVPVLKIKVYDNGVVDGDTVSIYFNDRLVVDRKLLSETPIELELQLNESWTKNELLLYAHNLGSIPPNTAVIIVTAGKQRYELLSGQDLNSNSVLYFDYKPKD